jgi:arsenite methyltransferase
MAELTRSSITDPGPTDAESCCVPAEQATCCEPAAKAACCDANAGGESCGCAAGPRTESEELREVVRERYAAAVRAVVDEGGSCDCATPSTTDTTGTPVFGGVLYEGGQAEGATATAVQASLGCGVPTAVADLDAGETVLDLGSGGRRRRADLGATRGSDRQGDWAGHDRRDAGTRARQCGRSRR